MARYIPPHDAFNPTISYSLLRIQVLRTAPTPFKEPCHPERSEGSPPSTPPHTSRFNLYRARHPANQRPVKLKFRVSNFHFPISIFLS